MIYKWYLIYKSIYGEQIARQWMDLCVDFWYTEDKEVINKFKAYKV